MRQRLGEHDHVASVERHLDDQLAVERRRQVEAGTVAPGDAHEPARPRRVIDECPLCGDQARADVAALHQVVLRRIERRAAAVDPLTALRAE